MPIQLGNQFGSDFGKLLGLPKNVVWFELRCAVNEAVTVKCAHYPDIPEIDDSGELVKLFSEYTLVKKEEE
jgi:hypothetical protein